GKQRGESVFVAEHPGGNVLCGGEHEPRRECLQRKGSQECTHRLTFFEYPPCISVRASNSQWWQRRLGCRAGCSLRGNQKASTDHQAGNECHHKISQMWGTRKECA